jgi:hypothetical protein
MELLNATKMQAGYTGGLDPSGREHVVVVVKGTFAIPRKQGATALLADEQVPLVMADEFTGEPGFSAPLYEADYALRKPRCDVLLNGSAHASGGRPAERVSVSLKVGSVDKTFTVVGNRVWRRGLPSIAANRPDLFAVLPISYNTAFGGAFPSKKRPEELQAYRPNPVGVGFGEGLDVGDLIGKPLPNTEEAGHSVTKPDGRYRPMAFGSVGRSWEPRVSFAGTYDQNWIDNVFPFLPADFDERYYQCAPTDQQTDYLRGGEEVVLVNLTEQGRTVFRLPTIEMPVTFYLKQREQKTMAVADTLLIEPDLHRVVLVWRAALPLRKNMFEVNQVVVGTMPRGWHRARVLGKTWYRSLKELVDTRRQEREEEEPVSEVDEELDEAGG